MTPVSTDEWELFSTYLDQALELEEPQRAEWLAALAQSHPAMAELVWKLLADREHEGYSNFLAGPPAIPVDDIECVTLIGRQVGPYVIDAEIGRGGMGSVWRAHRADGRFETEVAIKFVHLAWLGRGGEQRFRMEGNLLGQLNHPNIARLLDAGLLDSTQPYLVLEYVRGEPIDQYCASRELDVESRTRLFIDVLGAVAHAHSHLIVHRDIKPANIFVTGDGQVKLLDFGIAKLLDGGSSAALTQSNATALTPQYAAPEQLTGKPVTTATDVYALGLVLCQLLTGRYPLDLDSTSSAALIKAVLTQDPPRASTIATLPGIKARALTGDLDNIILKALKKSPAERYPSAEALAADLRGYLNHEPISARRDSFTYVIGKLVRRHRLQVGAASVTLMALIAGIIGTTWQAHEARRQRADALAQRDRATELLVRHDAVFDFVEMMLTESVPHDQVPALQAMLDRGTKFVDAAAVSQPERQAEILRLLASYYIDLDDAQKSLSLLESARQLLPASADLSLRAELACTYGKSLHLLGRSAEAQKLYEQWGENSAIDDNVAALCLQNRAIMAQNQGMASEALKYTDLALARAAKAPIPSGKFIAELTGDRGFALHMAGRNGEANRYFESARDQFRKLGLEDFNPSRSTMGNWGLVAYGSGDYKHGFEIYDHLLHIQERLAGTEPVSPGALGNYAHGLEALGRYPEALEAYNRTYDSAVQTGFVGAQGYALIGKASVLVQLGDLAGAQSNLDRATALIQGRMAESSPIQLRRAFTQSQIESAQGRVHEALASVTHLIDGLLAHNQRLNPAAVSAYRERAELEVQDRGHDAEVDAREAVKIAEALQGGNRFSGDTGGAYLTLGSVLAKAGDARGARAALETAVDHLSHALGPEHPATKRAQDLGAQLDPAVHAVQTASQ